MIWLTWRQHRLMVALVGAVLIGFATWFLLLGNGMRDWLGRAELVDCIGIGIDCGEWTSSLSMLSNLQGTLLPVLPALIGAFLGAPMLTREIEQRTFRYAWTQGISREHWLFSKVFLLGGAVAVLSTVFSAAYVWYFQPAVPEWSWFEAFGMVLPSFPATCVFGFALGVLAGTVTKHLLVGMALSLVGFLAVFLPVVAWLRPHYMSPQRLTADEYYRGPRGWVTESVYRSPEGEEFDIFGALRASGVPHAPNSVGSAEMDQLSAAGYTRILLVQPGSRFWTFQFVDAGVFLVLGAACIALTCWLLRRKAI
ncbi:ABC transporter permease subunit [Saccharopolyspora elongata]|uniref:ABC-2 family transporter protein n=1 Tax=Saccharopolyspora elongata TaxID=2530387 RepID=A0A4R4ZC43_9PSEU|nr:ABC transporter permease subunit [Saccharopolyspora elongata]TDD54789.1 hypothetical protein E1288_06025 [Saccharopolyspora elongata]